MVDEEASAPRRRRAARRPAGPTDNASPETAAPETAAPTSTDAESAVPVKGARKRTAKKTTTKATSAKSAPTDKAPTDTATSAGESEKPSKPTATALLFQSAPEVVKTPAQEAAGDTVSEDAKGASKDADDDAARKRRRRGGRGRKRSSEGSSADGAESSEDSEETTDGEDSEEVNGDDSGTPSSSRKRRRRRRRSSADDSDIDADDPDTVVKVREPRASGDVSMVRGSTRLEAKKQRRREGREAGRRRAPILTEAEFLARRESVERVMVVRQGADRIQIAVIEDGVLVEHYVTKGSSGSMVGNVYLGRVQNVLPSMEAAFVDIGRGRNAVLYAGEVNWDAAGLDGQPKRIELALKTGDPVLVQVTKDPVGQKGARLTSQISLPGRFLVYVPDGSMTGISRRLPDTERNRLKDILKRVMPEESGVIVRTAAEGASEEALEADVERLQALWTDITENAKGATPPSLLYSEPDLSIKVVRDIFNEDVSKLIVSGDSAWTTIDAYISAVAPDLVDRLEHWVKNEDVFAEFRIDEQLMKALDRKVYLPSGGSLVIDRTEAMTVVDVNTGKFIGQGGNLEETVTKNNLEAAEEIVRQLRLRDIGGIIVVDFIDMVLESNRDLVLRRLVECLGRDRTKHQVAEVTSLGLVQMTRKRIGSGLVESFSTTCEHCSGRGIKVSLHDDPDHAHEATPRSRKPAGVVDPAEVAARALVKSEEPEETPEQGADPTPE